MVLAERSGRKFNFSCQAAISFHIIPPCYRHSYIIGAVFGKIPLLTVPIIYHMGGETVPISLLFGTVSCENQWLVVLVDLPPHKNSASFSSLPRVPCIRQAHSARILASFYREEQYRGAGKSGRQTVSCRASCWWIGLRDTAPGYHSGILVLFFVESSEMG